MCVLIRLVGAEFIMNAGYCRKCWNKRQQTNSFVFVGYTASPSHTYPPEVASHKLLALCHLSKYERIHTRPFILSTCTCFIHIFLLDACFSQPPTSFIACLSTDIKVHFNVSFTQVNKDIEDLTSPSSVREGNQLYIKKR